MIKVQQRQEDVLSLISHIDISPIMYKNAVSKYQAITSYLQNQGIDADMYPQGSFAHGTVTRPFTKSGDATYDLDFICQVSGSKANYTPSELRSLIQSTLENSDLYGGKLEVFPECFTIHYADINTIGFSIDIVPAVDEESKIKQRLLSEGDNPTLIPTSIAIPKHNGERNYRWITNNPRGFAKWFEEANAPFLLFHREDYRRTLFEKNRTFYASVDDIPSAMERSPLQRVIQILKVHRDVYYQHFSNGDDLKPISAMLTAITAQIARTASPSYSVFELLDFVLKELAIYEFKPKLQPSDFTARYGSHSILDYDFDAKKWYLSNPANPEDNLIDKWNSDSQIPELFFRWANSIRSDLITTLNNADDINFRNTIENAFGKKTVATGWGNKYQSTFTPPKKIEVTSAAKPYRKL